uniref:Selenoprotein F n=1 Tax=Acrobeloides nanus TaxID=290746 RepID=A0A914BUN3_9BILA
MLTKYLISFAVFLINCLLATSELTYTPDECKELGFNVNTLKCSACDILTQFQLEQILTDCQRCCTKDKVDTHEKFPMAQIEICECNLHRFPQVNHFVKSELKDQWGSKLKVKHVRGTLPTIVLKNHDGQPQRSLNVEKWDTDTITEFLNDWLE